MLNAGIVVTLFWLLGNVVLGFRVLESGKNTSDGAYPQPYESGFVGRYGEPSNLQRERINEGAFETAEQELLYEGTSPRQACPGMVGPFTDGNFFCTAREFGYCDRRSGTCFCNTGYKGIDCSECQDSHFLIGSACFPKKLCTNDCNGAGSCDFSSGRCTCLPHRTGASCETLLCSRYSTLCTSCDTTTCLNCLGGYYLSGEVGNSTHAPVVCRSCYDFDPRCAGCTKDLGCTVCADSLLTSVHRSGYRTSDPALPVEERTREFGITLPFGTKSPESFADAENYEVVATADNSLKGNAMTCDQGAQNDAQWDCTPLVESHIVCGHLGVFTFGYPNYGVSESTKSIRMYVHRTGGGYGAVAINYFIKHFTTNDSDVVATAPYTTLQRLFFDSGVVERSFLITILDDNIVEEDEVFQVVLETPEGGGAVGAQFRANVTIFDDDKPLFSPYLSKTVENTTEVSVAESFSVHVKAVAADGTPFSMGGELFYAIIGNNPEAWQDIENPLPSNETLRQPMVFTDLGNGLYKFTSTAGIKPKGVFDLRVYHAFPNATKGEYYYDGFFERLAVRRLDHNVNFTWGTGRLIPRGSDYISIRWSGAIMAPVSGSYYFTVLANDHARLWINNVQVLNNWINLTPVTVSAAIFLEGGVLHEIVLEFLEITGSASAQLMWQYGSRPMHLIPQSSLFALFEVDRSPIKVTVKGGVSSTNTTHANSPSGGLSNATALSPSYFSVCPRDEFGNLLDDGDLVYESSQLYSATLVLVSDMGYNGTGSEYIMPDLVFNATSHCFDGTYIPQKAGRYQLNITYQANGDRFGPYVNILGSPFTIIVLPGKTCGPASTVDNIPHPLLTLYAGTCTNFSMTVRDCADNLRKTGGDNIEVYMYRVNQYYQRTGDPIDESPTTSPNTRFPTKLPSTSPTYSPSTFAHADDHYTLSPISDAGVDVVRYGLVADQGDGTYKALICPVISGIYEVHVLLGGKGVSNQPFRILDHHHSEEVAMGMGSYSGQYIGDSPYALRVKNTEASGITTTAAGAGLVSATVGVPVSFTVTVRDPYDNVLRNTLPSAFVTAHLDRSPSAIVHIHNFNNGSYNIEYIPLLKGPNLISVRVNGFHIRDSPFTVPVLNGSTSATYSYATGPGLLSGVAGVPSYFQVYAYDLDNNRVETRTDNYTFSVTGANVVGNTYMHSCPSPPQSDHPICDALDTVGGHYFGVFTPLLSGANVVRVFLEAAATSGANRRLASSAAQELATSSFTQTVTSAGPTAAYSDISGTLYDNIAGVAATVRIQTRDPFRNLITVGGHSLELALLGVAGQWGTEEPFTPLQGRANQYYYKGFYGGYPRVYGTVSDHEDGSYVLSYSTPTTGQYVMRLSLAEAGLNATYFNGTTFGHLSDGNHNDVSFAATKLGAAVNLGTTISWTGDVGGVPGARGGMGSGSYEGRFLNRLENNISFDLRHQDPNRYMGNVNKARYRFRDTFWSARWIGMITPEHAELYRFSVDADSDSSVRILVGGVGSQFNGTQPGVVVLDRPGQNSATISSSKGMFNFTDVKYREFVLEYAHFDGDAHLELFWESASTPRSIVPSSAFQHWVNISHYNTTIHPAALCSTCSTVYGAALNSAQVAVTKSFVVYARDRFGNLLQVGGDQVTMVAVGQDGVAFRGRTTDYGNSTYLIEYFPTQAGTFRMYVTIGCCAPTSDKGYPAEIQLLSHLLVQGAPFILHVEPATVDQTRSVAAGKGLLGGLAGEVLSLSVKYRDQFNNPSTVNDTQYSVLTVSVVDALSGDAMILENNSTSYSLGGLTFQYSLRTAGKFNLSLSLAVNGGISTQVVGSPFSVQISPIRPLASNTVCRGLGLRQAHPKKTASFEVQLYDKYANNLIVGGDKFYMRLLGDARFHRSSIPVVPACSDTQNGRYVCSYTPQYNGSHELVVRLLNNSGDHPGGGGLTARYYNSADGAVAASDDFVSQQIDSQVRFDWSDGLLVPVNNSNGKLPLGRSAGQSVRWSGYLVVPRTESFNIMAASKNLNVTVYLDSSLMFNSWLGLTNSVSLISDAAYALTVIASMNSPASSELPLLPASIDLRWSTVGVRQHSVPSFFLFDSAQDVALSPFPVKVN